MTFSRMSSSTTCDDNAGCYEVSIFGVEVYRAGREMVKIGVGQKGEGKLRQNHDQRITAPDKPNLIQSNTQNGFG